MKSGMSLKELEKALDLHSDYVLCSYDAAQNYLLAAGRDDDFAPFRDKAKRFYDELAKANAERRYLGNKAKLVPHDLTEEKIGEILKVITPIKRLTMAYLTKKEVEHLQDKPCYVLAIVIKRGLLEDQTADEYLKQDLYRCLVEIPLLIVTVDARYSGSRKRFETVDNSLIYSSAT